MSQIINSSKELSKKEAYKLTHSSKTSMSEAKGLCIKIAWWAIYTRTTEDGNVDVLNIVAEDGTIFATSSQAFLNSFNEMVEALDFDDYETIKVSEKTSKQGRTYYVAELVD